MCIHPRRSNACVIYLILSKVYFFRSESELKRCSNENIFFFLAQKRQAVLFSILFLSRALNADRDPHLADKTTKDGIIVVVSTIRYVSVESKKLSGFCPSIARVVLHCRERDRFSPPSSSSPCPPCPLPVSSRK